MDRLFCGARPRGHARSVETTSARNASWATGGTLVLVSGLSSQLGAAVAATVFPQLGFLGVVAIRQLVTVAVLVPLVRPNPLRWSRLQWRPVLLLALTFATVSLPLYAAIQRLGLGLAIALEFLGPVTIAIARSRSLGSAFAVSAATTGVLLVVAPGPTTDWLGVGCGLTAACLWALYIWTNSTVGARAPGLEGTAVASALAALLYLPVAAVALAHVRIFGSAVGTAALAGVLASVVPFVTDLLALRRLPQAVYATGMSINPLLAAALGALLLHERLTAAGGCGFAVIVVANVVAVRSSRGERPEGGRGTAAGAVAGLAERPAVAAAHAGEGDER